MIELRAPGVTATVVPETGGRVGSIDVGGVELLVGGDPGDAAITWGAFPMAPFAGRLRDGRFVHEGVEHRLPLHLPPHGAHGTVFDVPWARTDGREDPGAVELGRPLDDPWPLGGRVDARVEVTAGALAWRLRVTAGDRAMPAELGWHPWFRAAGPVGLTAAAMYERGDDHLPTGRLVAVGPGPWDDCFLPSWPVRFAIGPLEVHVESDADHVVVFDGSDIGLAVEPQSGPPDAFHLRPRVLGPGEVLERTMTISWRAGPQDRR